MQPKVDLRQWAPPIGVGLAYPSFFTSYHHTHLPIHVCRYIGWVFGDYRTVY